MEIHPPLAIIVNVPGCTFSLAAFSHAYPVQDREQDLKIEFVPKGHVTIRDFSLESLNEALLAAGPPSELKMPL